MRVFFGNEEKDINPNKSRQKPFLDCIKIIPEKVLPNNYRVKLNETTIVGYIFFWKTLIYIWKAVPVASVGGGNDPSNPFASVNKHPSPSLKSRERKLGAMPVAHFVCFLFEPLWVSGSTDGTMTVVEWQSIYKCPPSLLVFFILVGKGKDANHRPRKNVRHRRNASRADGAHFRVKSCQKEHLRQTKGPRMNCFYTTFRCRPGTKKRGENM